MTSEPNVCQFMQGLRALRSAVDLDPGEPASKQAMERARQTILAGVDQLNHLLQWDQTPNQVKRVFHHIDNGNSHLAVSVLDKMICQTAPLMPRFRIVLFNETKNWISPELVQAAGEIYGAYLYDENRKVNMADIRPSYELKHLYNTSACPLSDEMQEMLGESSDSMSMYCVDVDKIDWRHKHFCGAPSDPNANSYRELEGSEAEYYQSNINIEVPRPASLQMVLHAADEQILAGYDLSAVEGLKSSAKLSEMADDRAAILASVLTFQTSPDIGRLRSAMVDIYQTHCQRKADSEEAEETATRENCAPI